MYVKYLTILCTFAAGFQASDLGFCRKRRIY